MLRNCSRWFLLACVGAHCLACAGSSQAPAASGADASSEGGAAEKSGAEAGAESTQGPEAESSRKGLLLATSACAAPKDPEVDRKAAAAARDLIDRGNAVLNKAGEIYPLSAPYTVEGARAWTSKMGGAWFQIHAQGMKEIEAEVKEIPAGTYGRARATIVVAAVWNWFNGVRPELPQSVQVDDAAREVYLGDWPRVDGVLVSARARKWRGLAQVEATRWGLFQDAIDKPWLRMSHYQLPREKFGAASGPFETEKLAARLSEGLPAQYLVEEQAPDWPSSAEDLAALGQWGFSPRQLVCAKRFEGGAQANLVLGRYFVTRAIFFGDVFAAKRGLKLLEGNDSKAASQDRALARRVLKTRPETAAKMAIRVEDLKSRGRPKAGLGDMGYSWWVGARPFRPHRGPRGTSGRIEGIQVILDDGGYFIIPYTDSGLDYCAMVRTYPDGHKEPHRPPDSRGKCKARRKKEAEASGKK